MSDGHSRSFLHTRFDLLSDSYNDLSKSTNYIDTNVKFGVKNLYCFKYNNKILN